MNSTKSNSVSLIQKIFLRFIFLYVVLYIFPYGFEYIIGLETGNWSFWKTITTTFGEVFLGWEFNHDRLMNGLDSKYDFARFLLIAIFSILIAFLWWFIDSKLKKNYDNFLKRLLETILRYHVGLTLIIYGLSKVFLLQFGVMDIDSLETKIGDHNGMGFIWTFMSYSKFYGITAGLIEVIGGALLLFRRTTSLGCFLLLIAMTNVVLMDIGFDVVVKMFAIHLLLMIVILMWEDMKRLFVFFLGNKATIANKFEPLFKGAKAKKIGLVLKVILLIYFTYIFNGSMRERIESQHGNDYAHFTSSHEVEVFVMNGDTIPENTNGMRWKKMNVNDVSYMPESLSITKADDTSERFKFTADTLSHKMILTSAYDKSQEPYELSYAVLQENVFVYQGIFQGVTIWVRTKAKKLNDYRLIKNDIRWIRDLK